MEMGKLSEEDKAGLYMGYGKRMEERVISKNSGKKESSMKTFIVTVKETLTTEESSGFLKLKTT